MSTQQQANTETPEQQIFNNWNPVSPTNDSLSEFSLHTTVTKLKVKWI